VRRAARRDDNHADIVRALRKVGCNVLDLGAVGNGCPDLLVSFAGVLSLLEVKDGSKPPSARKLTDDQKLFHAVWAESRLAVVTTPEEAVRAATILTEGP
jgi:Holliday junction resolvase